MNTDTKMWKLNFQKSFLTQWCQLILQDIEMYDEVSDTPANARTSNLNEELGQVRAEENVISITLFI